MHLTDSGEPTNYTADKLWRLFEFIKLTEVMQQEWDPLFIGMFNKILIGETDDNSETMQKSSFWKNKEIYHPKQDFSQRIPQFQSTMIIY